MSEVFTVFVNGQPVTAGAEITVAALLLRERIANRHSCSGQPRAAFCGMGICMECRVTIDGTAHCLGCMTYCRPGMKITTP